MNKYKEKSPFISHVSSQHEPPEPPTSRKPTPAEALQLKIILPWTDKVQAVTPGDLTPILFGKLEEYGLYRQEIKQLFGFKFDADFYRWIHKNDIVSGGKTGPRGRQPHREPKLATKPGQTQRQAINAAARLDPDPEKVPDLDAELARVDQQLAAMGYGGAAARVVEIINDRFDAAVAGEGPIPSPADAMQIAAQAMAEQSAQAIREQVEEFFTDAEPAAGGVVSAETNAEILEKLQQQGPPPYVMPHPVTVNEFRDGGRKCGKTIMMSNPGGPEWPPTPESVDALRKTIEDEWRKTVVELPIAEPSGLAVNQDHYNACGEIQPIEAMQASMELQRFIGKLQGDVIKYAMRAGKKGSELADVEKIIQYSTWWRDALLGKKIDPREGTKR